MGKVSSLLILIALLLSACSGAAPQAAATAQPTVLPPVSADGTIVSEGRVVPSRSVNLAFVTSGQVAEVLVKEGDTVKAGDIVARLGDRERLEADIASAELELFLANQTLADLDANLPEAQTAALEEVTNAREALREAERKAGSLVDPQPASDNDIEIARANVAIAKRTLDRASEDYKPWENKPQDNLTRAALLQKLADAQTRYNDAVRKLNKLLGVSSVAFEVTQAEAQLQIAQARMEQAQKKYDTLMVGPDPVDVDAAQARITNAESALNAAKAALGNLELKASIDGMVVNLDLIAGQQVSPGQAVMTLADFSTWFVETDNLTEVDVVNVAVGQAVRVVPDAIAEVELVGKVEAISNTFEEKRGDITYTVRIGLDQIDPRLRWGMTVVATFEKR